MAFALVALSVLPGAMTLPVFNQTLPRFHVANLFVPTSSVYSFPTHDVLAHNTGRSVQQSMSPSATPCELEMAPVHSLPTSPLRPTSGSLGRSHTRESMGNSWRPPVSSQQVPASSRPAASSSLFLRQPPQPSSISIVTVPVPSTTTFKQQASRSKTIVPATRTIVPASSTASLSLPSPIPATNRSTAAANNWQTPEQFLDADDAFNITQWVWGQDLTRVLPHLPDDDNFQSSVLRVEYPKGSINPSGSIKGGAGFYSEPLDLSKAQNVSLSYSVYFPKTFDFQKGGKLPGLYGGRGGCSGGNDALDCFSTRLMFRAKGAGELYLYAPIGKQPPSVCNLPPYSTCSTNYGASLGRGSWTFARGGWTDIRQDIWLNTPGKADGGFNIWANGVLALTADHVLYRDALQASKNRNAANLASDSRFAKDGLLTDLVNQILQDRREAPEKLSSPSFVATATQPVSFAGIMFATFFGGSSSSYASPKKQYSYFKGFKLSVNQ